MLDGLSDWQWFFTVLGVIVLPMIAIGVVEQIRISRAAREQEKAPPKRG